MSAVLKRPAPADDGLPMLWPPFETKMFTASGAIAHHPKVEVEVDADCKILGGGAFVNWRGGGNLLTAMYPESPRKWVAMAKDHGTADPASISAWAIALHDPLDVWEVTYVSSTGSTALQPHAIVTLPPGFALTGGGARVNWSGAGNLLTSSYPSSAVAWKAESKDQFFECPASITVFAIGVRPRLGDIGKGTMVFCYESDVSAHPQAKVVLPSGYVLTGGGARDNWSGRGNFLVASFPNGDMAWEARGKDHGVSCPSSITAYVIGFPESAA